MICIDDRKSIVLQACELDGKSEAPIQRFSISVEFWGHHT